MSHSKIFNIKQLGKLVNCSMKDSYTYILSNRKRTSLYIGVTNDLKRRMFEHKAHKGLAFCRRYNLEELMYYEHYGSIQDAIDREKQLKRWHKDWKWNLIRSLNPELMDLSGPWFDKDDLNDIKEFRLSDELRFNSFSMVDKPDPETSQDDVDGIGQILKQVQDDVGV